MEKFSLEVIGLHGFHCYFFFLVEFGTACHLCFASTFFSLFLSQDSVTFKFPLNIKISYVVVLCSIGRNMQHPAEHVWAIKTESNVCC